MLSILLPALLAPLQANAAPAPVPAAEPTLFTFTYEGQPVTATWYGTGTQPAQACPTQTFTYAGAVITAPYTGPGTPQSCLTSAAAAAPTTTAAAGNVATAAAMSTTTASTTASTTSAKASTFSAAASSGITKGFNYGSTGVNGAALQQADFESSFNTAKNLVGASGFTSARLFTTIQAGTTNTPISAIPAAINTGTKLLLGLWASAGDANIQNEITALKTAISQYGSSFTDLIIGISVGSEDLYRISPTGIENLSGVGAEPADIIQYVSEVRAAIAGTLAAKAPVGHVDTWTAYVNGSNAAVISALDFVGVDAYPYFQNTQTNGIAQAADLFKSAYQATVAVAGAKPVWVTETGWPVSGATENLAVPSTANAQTYWDAIGCGFLFDKIPTFWYILNDNGANPSFGVTTGSTTPLYSLSCPAS